MDDQWQTDRSKRAGVSSLPFAFNIVFWKVDDDDDDDGAVMMTQTHLREEQEALLVNSVVMAKATTGLQSSALLTDLSKQACDLSLYKDATDRYMCFFLLLLLWHCVCLCIHVSLRKSMKPEAYICRVFGAWNRLWCCLASRRQNRCCSSLCRCPSGRLQKTKCPPRVQTVRSLSIYPFHYELWFDPLSCCLSCSFIRYKPPQPQQDSKGGHTVQQGSHEANKHDQIKARFFIPGIRREFFTTLLLFLLKYEWLCLSCVQIIYLCVSRPFVAPSGLKYSEGLSVCHVCFVSTVFFVAVWRCCFELSKLHSDDFCGSWSQCCRKSTTEYFAQFGTISNLHFVKLLQIICPVCIWNLKAH